VPANPVPPPPASMDSWTATVPAALAKTKPLAAMSARPRAMKPWACTLSASNCHSIVHASFAARLNDVPSPNAVRLRPALDCSAAKDGPYVPTSAPLQRKKARYRAVFAARRAALAVGRRPRSSADARVQAESIAANEEVRCGQQGG
jgi:hypothetical protein